MPPDLPLAITCTQIAELLFAGADLTVKDNNGKSPMDLATKPEVLDMMKAHLAKQGSASKPAQ